MEDGGHTDMEQEITEQLNIRRNKPKHNRRSEHNKQCPSAGRFFSIFSASAVTLLILLSAITFNILLNANGEKAHAASSVSLSISSSTITTDITPSGSSNNGATFSDLGQSTISAWTDNATGYTLSIKSSNTTSDANKYLVHASDSNTKLTAITAKQKSSAFNVGQWGYKPSTYYDTTNNTNIDNTASDQNYYFQAPGSLDTILSKTTTANNGTSASSSNSDNYTINLGAKVDYSTKVGTYNNTTFIISAITNPLIYNVTYTNKSGVTASNMPANITGAATAAGSGSFTLSSTTPTRTGYTFNKWCSVSPTTTNGVDSCSGGTSYSAGATYALTGTISPQSVTLYAMWTANTYNLVITGDSNVASMSVKAGSTSGTTTNCTKSGTTFTCSALRYTVNYYLYPTFNSGYKFSSWTKTDSASGAALSSTSSENAYYTMGRAAGALTLASKQSCDAAMQDLSSVVALLPSTGSTATVCDSRDNQAYTVGKLADGNYWMLDNLALDLTNSTVLNGMSASNTNASATTLNYLKGTSTGTTSDKYATAKVANWTSSYSYSAPLVNLTNKDVIPTDATSTAGGWKVGGYYNYCAASAGSHCYGNGTSAGTSSGNATEDICPKGWRMPTGSSSGEFQTLYNNASYNTYANYRAALHLPLSGYFTNGSPNDPGSGGCWWSSTRGSNSNMYRLNANTSNIYPASGGNRSYGFSLRCIIGS